VIDQAEPAVVDGRTLSFPVEVRRARMWGASFLVPARPAAALIAESGLEPAQPVPGRALMTLVTVRYLDTDLDAYHEVGVTFAVRPPGTPRPGPVGRTLETMVGAIGSYIHRLPVNREFTMHAGRQLWGFPKTLADIDIATAGGATRITLSEGGHHELTLTILDRRRAPIPLATPASYTLMDGVLRETESDSSGSRVAAAPAGGILELGTGPVADELRELGLPRRPVMTMTGDFRARFGPARIVKA
jgi:hypothetical protein